MEPDTDWMFWADNDIMELKADFLFLCSLKRVYIM